MPWRNCFKPLNGLFTKWGDSVLGGSGEDDRGMRLASLLVDEGARPDVAVLARLEQAGAFAISNRAADGVEWVELLRDGLTFDLDGLAPGPAAALPGISSWYGFEAQPGLSAMTLSVGPHLAGAAHLLPVVKAAASLLAALSALPGVSAVAWLPASTATRRDWFATAADAWERGGPFPALALSALERDERGTLRSRGLAFLVGAEFALTGVADLAPEAAARIAIRLSDWLVAHGIPAVPGEVELDGGTVLWLAAVPGGTVEAHLR